MHRHLAREPFLAAVLVVLGVLLVHGEQIRRNLAQPHWEDFRFFRHNRAEVASLADCVRKPGVWPGLYRPLTTTCYYYAGRRLFGNRLEAYHAVNAGLFLLNGMLLYLVARRLLPAGWALLPPVLFVTRRAHVQLVRYTTEFQGLLSTGLALTAVLLFMLGRQRRRGAFEAAAVFALAAALLAKETTLVVPVLLAAYAWLFDVRRAWRRALPAVALAAAWLAALPIVLGAVGAESSTGFRFDVSFALSSRYTAYLFDFSNALVGTAVNVEMPEGVLAATGPPARAVTLALGALAAVTVALRATRGGRGERELRVVAFGVMWFFAAAAPYAVLADRLFMRYSYLPHAGVALAMGGAAAWSAHVLARLMARRRAASAPTPAPAMS